MALIELKDIGKIYVSGNNVSVGIRGVNLAFDKGEFVAITGQSGSGKSTLLNVISGMDTYEEGEMLVCGEPTSHYVQQDWEEYRKQYISFIFQDYNIIENFTVLQNVELALMHISNHKERRARAVELLTRVGLESHLHHKGSKLSGGQKQRTVIARALAKDSPVILADEPTGNLDSQSSKEIIALLREVSKEKLVIIVTHNFDQVKDYATRHIRVFDGAIESDHVISSPHIAAGNNTAPAEENTTLKNKAAETFKRYGRNLRNGLTLGRVRFTSMPKLSAFLCMLMVISAIAIMLITSLSGRAFEIFDKDYVFTHIDGRSVIARQDGAVMTDEELETLTEKTGAQSYMHYDYLLDQQNTNFSLRNEINGLSGYAKINFGNFGKIDVGRAPKNESEVLLRLPLHYKQYIDMNKNYSINSVFQLTDYDVTGISYFYDNTKNSEIVFTEAGYRTAAALAYLSSTLSGLNFNIEIADNSETREVKIANLSLHDIYISYDIEKSTYYLNNDLYLNNLQDFLDRRENAGDNYTFSISAELSGTFTTNNYGSGEQKSFSFALDDYQAATTFPSDVKYIMQQKSRKILLPPQLVSDFIYSECLSKNYTQASLFFANDFQANAKTSELRKLGYVAIPSSADMSDLSADNIMDKLLIIPAVLIWLAAVIFVTMLVCFCSSRAMQSSKGDIAILRSMGVASPVIKISIFIQMLITLVPTYIITALVAVLIFVIPQTNGVFVFLHAGAYVAIALAIFVVTILVAMRYTRKMFKSSVKKTLKGDIGA